MTETPPHDLISAILARLGDLILEGRASYEFGPSIWTFEDGHKMEIDLRAPRPMVRIWRGDDTIILLHLQEFTTVQQVCLSRIWDSTARAVQSARCNQEKLVGVLASLRGTKGTAS